MNGPQLYPGEVCGEAFCVGLGHVRSATPGLSCNSYVMFTVNKMCQDKAHMLHAVADQEEYLEAGTTGR